MSRWKSFLIGQFSGFVEPIAGVLGVLFGRICGYDGAGCDLRINQEKIKIFGERACKTFYML